MISYSNTLRRIGNLLRNPRRVLMHRLGKTGIPFFAALATRSQYASHEKNRPRRVLDRLDGFSRPIFDSISENGYAVLPDFYSTKLCAKLVSETDRILKKHPNFVHEASDMRIFGAEHLSQSIMQFHNLKLGEELVNAYWQSPSQNAFTLAAKMPFTPGNQGSGEGWHRDSFFCQFKLILYLTDVSEQSGPFQYIRYSHRFPHLGQDIRTGRLAYMDTRASVAQVERIIQKSPERLVTVTAPRGTLLIADTSGLHRGKPIENGVRYALTNYYYPNAAFGPWMSEKFNLVPKNLVRKRK